MWKLSIREVHVQLRNRVDSRVDVMWGRLTRSNHDWRRGPSHNANWGTHAGIPSYFTVPAMMETSSGWALYRNIAYIQFTERLKYVELSEVTHPRSFWTLWGMTVYHYDYFL